MDDETQYRYNLMESLVSFLDITWKEDREKLIFGETEVLGEQVVQEANFFHLCG